MIFRQSDATVATPFEPGGSRNWVNTLFSNPGGVAPFFAKSAGQALIAASGVTPLYDDLGDVHSQHAWSDAGRWSDTSPDLPAPATTSKGRHDCWIRGAPRDLWRHRCRHRRPLRRSVAPRLLVIVGLAALASTWIASPAQGSPAVPYTDPNAVGTIGLCDQSGHQITSGNINTVPFAWRAVSSHAATGPYANAWRTAILLAYQPQEGLSSQEWSGDALTASSRYTDPANPMAAATDGDDSLADFISDFHPRWDGYLELRIYLGTQDEPVYSLHYPALNIRVVGNTWSAVGGAPVNCAAGTSESLESIVLPPSATETASPALGHAPTPAASTGANAAATATTPAGRRRASAGATDTTSAAAVRSTSPTSPFIVGAVAVIAVAALVVVVVRRRRSRSLTPDPAAS